MYGHFFHHPLPICITINLTHHHAPSTSLPLVLDHILHSHLCKLSIKVPLSNLNLKPSYSMSKTLIQAHHIPIFQTHTTHHLGYSSAQSTHVSLHHLRLYHCVFHEEITQKLRSKWYIFMYSSWKGCIGVASFWGLNLWKMKTFFVLFRWKKTFTNISMVLPDLCSSILTWTGYPSQWQEVCWIQQRWQATRCRCSLQVYLWWPYCCIYGIFDEGQWVESLYKS